MTPVYKLSTSRLSSRTSYSSMLAGNTAYTLPGDYQSISTVSLSSNQSSVTFSSIPQTYTHLQLRVFGRTARSAGPDILCMQMNGDTAGNYADHYFYGDGSTPQTDGNINYSTINVQRIATANSGSSIFSGIVIDILDYANTNKFKTIKYSGGFDANGSGRVGLGTGLWRSTNGVSSLNMFSSYSENWTQYSHFALYGIKAVS